MSNRAALAAACLVIASLVALAIIAFRPGTPAPSPEETLSAAPADRSSEGSRMWSPKRIYERHPRLFLKAHRLAAADGPRALVESNPSMRAALACLRAWCDGMREREPADLDASPVAVNALLRRSKLIL